jgi:hypothetical protein
MKNKIKSICLSKTNILSISSAFFFFLIDIKQVITGFASYLYEIGVFIIVLVGLLIINLLMTKTKNDNNENTSSANTAIINSKEKSVQTNTSHKNRNIILAKIVFSVILFVALMTLGSLYYVKNMGVYYVVLKNDLTKQEADNLMKSTNNSYEFSTHGLSSRVLELPNDKYELILRNGYINEYKAVSDLEKVKSLKLVFKPYKVGPQYVANYFKKIKYLQHDFFN